MVAENLINVPCRTVITVLSTLSVCPIQIRTECLQCRFRGQCSKHSPRTNNPFKGSFGVQGATCCPTRGTLTSSKLISPLLCFVSPRQDEEDLVRLQDIFYVQYYKRDNTKMSHRLIPRAGGATPRPRRAGKRVRIGITKMNQGATHHLL